MLRYNPEFRVQLSAETLAQEGESKIVREKTTQLYNVVKIDKSIWQKSQKAMTKFYNRHRKGRSYAIRDEVMLSSRNIRIRKASKKLINKFLDPFRVITIQGKNVYELELPKSYRRIYRTFHVTLLEPY
jgi:uncharacterized protein YtpQ (UPF0354 family)